MTPMDPKLLSADARKVFEHMEFDADEKLLFEVRKHWFGLFIIYLVGTFVTVMILAVALGAAVVVREGRLEDTGINTLAWPIVMICFVAAILSLIVTAIAAYLYKTNVLLVTSDKLAQLLNISLFNRKISQLSIGDVQDVTVHQRGIFAHAYKF